VNCELHMFIAPGKHLVKKEIHREVLLHTVCDVTNSFSISAVLLIWRPQQEF
jgi:hypothetical protein